MACKKPECFRHLVDTLVKKELFTNSLNKKAWRCFIEILRNAQKSKMKFCFDSKTRKGLKKYRKTLKYLTSKKISRKKRQKRLKELPEKTKNFIEGLFKKFIEEHTSLLNKNDVEGV